ncbi:MAG: SRPBCC family protein [Acidimicrobiia bacterium]|nr:SRPBCC family protein [Acidimicrobiia bacterium]
MTAVSVEIVIDALPDEIWSYVEQIERHTEWMADAIAIRFHGEQRRGVGTTFECDTKVGPLRLTDEMEITRWEPERAMGVRHTGIVTGEGTFRIEPVNAISSRFRWDEQLDLPWYFGGSGRLATVMNAGVLGQVWRRNLRNLKHSVENGGEPHR